MNSFVEEKSTGFAETILIDRALEWQIAGFRERGSELLVLPFFHLFFSHCLFSSSREKKTNPIFSKMDLWSEPMTSFSCTLGCGRLLSSLPKLSRTLEGPSVL